MTVLTVLDIGAGDALPELTVDVTSTMVIMGSVATGDWSAAHHDVAFAAFDLGMANIFLSTPTQTMWLERYITDWTGPAGRIGRLSFRMRRSITAGSTMALRGEVTGVTVDETGCRWVDIDLTIVQTDEGSAAETATLAEARVAVPAHADDNPWNRRGDRWNP